MRQLFCTAALAAVLALGSPALAQQQPSDTSSPATSPPSSGGGEASGPIRLRQPKPTTEIEGDPSAPLQANRREAAIGEKPSNVRGTEFDEPTAALGEFEAFVQKQAGPRIRIQRFGSELMLPSDAAAESNPKVPPDYLVKAGDELVVTLWGSVDADLRLRVDRSGRISIPRVGPVLVAGVRHADLNATIEQRVSQVFRNFQISVGLAQVRAQRVYVTGFVKRPGAFNVNGLVTALQALVLAGGPSPAGSLRQVDVMRGGQRVATLDLYQFLLRGDRSADLVLQPEDVIHVGPVGTQVALIGSVNRPAVFELLPRETARDLLQMAGGFTAVADRTRLALERLDDRVSVRVVQLAWPAAADQPLARGDVLRAFSAVDTQMSMQRQNRRIRVEGEVARPGDYVLPPESTLQDALTAAGGLTPGAFVYGTEFTRESVRATQQQNYGRALRDLETDLARRSGTQRAAGTADEAALRAARDSANERLLNTLRNLRPSGRVVLRLPTDAQSLPPLLLEDGDRLYVPPRPMTVGVFGSVFNGGSYLHSEGRTLGEYLHLAGGPTRGADASSAFVVRADGTVASALASRQGFFSRDGGLTAMRAEPGDTLFVPEEIDKTTAVQTAKDWTQILYQFGIGLAGLLSATR